MRISDWSSDVCSSDLRRPSSLAWTRGHLTLDHGVLTADPFILGLKRGTIEGRVEVDQGNGGPVPPVTVALDLKGSTLSAIAGGGGAVDGRPNGQVRLVGQGGTFRAAMGPSDRSLGPVRTPEVLPPRHPT